MKQIAARIIIVSAALLFTPLIVAAQEHAAVDAEAPAAHATAQVEEPTYPHPTLPGDARWAFPVVMLIAVLFASAACIGWYIRLEMPEELPPTHSHDEPPGASHHHGRSGTLNPAPDHGPDQ
jgi:hypothetical protein